MKQIKKFPILLMSILFISLFWPCSYTMSFEPTEANLLTRRTRANSENSGCSSVVETVSLDAEEYKKLVELANDSVFDGFGNIDRLKEQQELDEADVSLEPGVNDAKNQFIMTDNGPMFVFDAMQHSVKDPKDESGCYLNNIIANGYIAYSTKIDQVIRFCSEYGYKACENGLYDLGEAEETLKEIEKISDFTGEFYNNQEIIDAEEVDWSDAKSAFGKTPESFQNAFGSFDDFKSNCESNGLNNCLDEIDNAIDLSFGTLNSQAGNEVKARGTWNNIQSNHTDVYESGADDLIMLPHNLAAFAKSLKELKNEETYVLAINLAAGAVSVGNMWKSYKVAKELKEISKLKDLKNIRKAIETSANEKSAANAIKNVLGDVDDVGEAKNALRAIENSKDFTGVEKKLAAATLKRLEKGESLADVTKDIGKTADEAKGLKQLTQMTDSELKETLEAKKLTVVGESTLDRTKLIEEMKKTVEILPEEETTLIGAVSDVKKFEALDNNLLSKLNLIVSRATDGKIASIGASQIDDLSTGIKYGGVEMNLFEVTQKAVAEASAGTGAFRRVGEAAYKARQAMKTASGWGKLIEFGKYASLRYVLGFNNFMKLGRLQAYIAFGAQFFGGQPEGFYEVVLPVFTLRPANTIVGAEGSYMDIITTKAAQNPANDQIFPTDFYTNMLNFIGIDLKQITGPNEYTSIYRKITNIGPVVSIVDQETGATSLTQSNFPTNLLTSHTDKFGQQRWFFHSTNPDSTLYYGFEDPKEYQNSGQTKYTSMGFISNNVNLTAFSTSVVGEYSMFNPISSAITNSLPSWQNMVAFAGVGGLLSPLFGSGFDPSTLRYSTAIIVTRELGSIATDVASNNNAYGQVVDINAAFESGKRCEDIKDGIYNGIKNLLHWKAALASANMALEVADFALAPTGIGLVASVSAQIIAGIADYFVSEQYVKAKEEGLESMKTCYETQYEFLAWQSMNTEEGNANEIDELLSNPEMQSFSNTIGVALNAISPNVEEAIQDMGQAVYSQTLHLRADPIEGKSIINMFGTEVYQVHFDREAEFKWFAENSCQIQICDDTPEGYRCITKQGYFLFDNEGHLIFDGPQANFLSWSNLETYASMPQNIINVAQKDEKFMEIYDNEVVFTDPCVKSEVAKNLGVELDSTKIPKVFDDLQKIVTDDAIIWFDGNEVTTTFMKTKECGESKFYEAQTIRVEDGHINLYRDGTVKIADADGNEKECEFDIGSSGTVAFENGLIVEGKGGSVTRGDTTYDISSDYNKLAGNDVLHLVIKDLLSFDRTEIDDWGIKGPCECVEDATGVSCTTDNGKTGAYLGFNMEGSLITEDTNQLNNILSDYCISELTGMNGEHMSYKDGLLCTTYEDGKEICENVTGIDEDGIHTDDGGLWKMLLGPDGPELWKYLNGEKTGNPIPLMWMNGLGGSIYNNPDTGRISIKNEFPFAINPSFNQYGALATGGFAVPGTPEWGGRTSLTNDNGDIYKEDKNVLAQLPILPEDPMWLIVFIISLMSCLIFVRVKYTKKDQ